MTPIRKLGTMAATTIMQLSTTAMEKSRSSAVYMKCEMPGWYFTMTYVMDTELTDIVTKKGNDEMKFERINTPTP